MGYTEFIAIEARLQLAPTRLDELLARLGTLIREFQAAPGTCPESEALIALRLRPAVDGDGGTRAADERLGGSRQ